jgi:hypothetical protein
MFKNAVLNLVAATSLLACATLFTSMVYEHARVVTECSRLRGLLETTLAEKALLQSLVSDHAITEPPTLNSGWISPSTLD